ncbi:hypothetical protein PA0356 [Candidatus Phytoplasma australiense]|uniref:Uncharacterized protein n=1 Tax=Phytoplasma australiense TaxID=59748 RepID=B1V9R9_PHYAS|nr:hypothetical protein PA0356 [Candidatus Phytoplasma australiense]
MHQKDPFKGLFFDFLTQTTNNNASAEKQINIKTKEKNKMNTNTKPQILNHPDSSKIFKDFNKKLHKMAIPVSQRPILVGCFLIALLGNVNISNNNTTLKNNIIIAIKNKLEKMEHHKRQEILTHYDRLLTNETWTSQKEGILLGDIFTFSRTKIKLEPEKEYFQITVQSNGQGIIPRWQKKISRPYFYQRKKYKI